MPTYSAILDAEVAPEAPITTSLITRLRDNALAYLGAPSGTSVVGFKQASAPLGWTKDTSNNDKGIRLVSGTPSTSGSVAYSTLHARTTTDAVTIAQANLPSLSFNNSGITLNDPGHPHANGYSPVAGAQAGAGAFTSIAVNTSTEFTGITISSQGVAASGGSGTAIQPGIDMRVSTVDVIAATKD